MSRVILPGDLVYHISIHPDVGSSIESGVVIAVDRDRIGAHLGCEDRLWVMWTCPLRIAHECDCEVTMLSEIDWSTMDHAPVVRTVPDDPDAG